MILECDVQDGTGEPWFGSGCIDDDPEFVDSSGGTWTSNGSYDSDDYQVTFIDDGANWETDELVGKFINPDTTQSLIFAVLSNTNDTITVWADWHANNDKASWVLSGDSYTIYDYHLGNENSPSVDEADNNAPELPFLDKDGNHRIWDGDGNSSFIVDMGAYEYDSQQFLITDMKIVPTGIEITWCSSVAKYDVWSSDEEFSDTMTWEVLQSDIQGAGGYTDWIDTTDPPASGHRFYKVSYSSY